MMRDPHMVFATDPNRGLVARSGWEQEEARTVLRDLGWEWSEELHALVPPDDVPEVDAGVQAVQELHLHGYLTGYAVSLGRAEKVFARFGEPDALEIQRGQTPRETHETTPPQRSVYSQDGTQVESPPPEALGGGPELPI